jgi:hypothetical protein
MASTPTTAPLTPTVALAAMTPIVVVTVLTIPSPTVAAAFAAASATHCKSRSFEVARVELTISSSGTVEFATPSLAD